MINQSELEITLNQAIKDFRQKVSNEILDRKFSKLCQGITKTIKISNNEMKRNHLPKVCPSQIDVDEFVQHYKDLEPYTQFSSSIESFAKLSKMKFTTRKKIPYLNKHQVEELRKSGARLHTLREKNDMVFDSRQRGVQFGNQNSSSVSGLIRTIGSKSGMYDDKFSPDGFFLYEPPCQPSGMLRFRWIQFLKQKYNIPMFFLLVRWFGLDSPISDKTIRQSHQAQKGKMAFMIIPVTVVDLDVQKENWLFFSKGKAQSVDIDNLGKSIERPLPLQMIEPEECFQIIYNLTMLSSKSLQFKNRIQLNPTLTLDYNYDSLQGTELEKKLQKWAKNNGKRCPDGSKCNNKRFDDPTIGKLHLGHIISQNWCNAFKLGDNFKNHPYNLYLSCGSCNAALNKFFPTNSLQDRLDKEKATIGDWAVQHDSAIRQTKP